MKESIAQSFIISLILFFFGILLLLLFGSINYSKAFKAKNRIVSIIEKYGSYPHKDDENYDENVLKKVINEIDENLAKGGYQTVLEKKYTEDKCADFVKKLGNATLVFPSEDNHGTGGRRYDYCVIRVNSSSLGNYYQVVTFMQFNVPVVGDILRFPVKGETKVLYETMK